MEGPDGKETFLRPVSDPVAVRACYDEYGVVGVTGVLSADEAAATIAAGLDAHLPEDCSILDKDTYHAADHVMNRYGVIGKSALFNARILETRLHPNVVAAYQAVYGCEDVIACHDRAAWMRPAALCQAWTTPFKWPGVHFDISLRGYYENGYREDVDAFLDSISYDNLTGFVAENNAKHESMGRQVQGVLNLLDNRDEDGGFHCVPGLFGDHLKTWVSGHKSLPDPEPNGRYELSAHGMDAELASWTERIPCPAGTLLLFDATLPHGTKPNISDESRAILFLRYIVGDTLPLGAWRSRNAALRRIAGGIGFQPDERQERHLYGPEQRKSS